ncbi:MAG TPA: FAD-binding protein [Gaiellaceae bacterium]|nr:FAD-binding protein [Gaiellaceae bacterium]
MSLESYEMHEHDVIVIGAGGAGLRAAIESSELGASTAVICKSLLGKAHTVMAEGGVAAALGNVDEADNWETHFQDTISAGKYLNNWRMAELHAKEAPDRVRELERWGGVFDRTPEGKMSQRAFGGHTHRRLVHIGDRTGLELLRTLQDRCVHQEVDVFMECTITHLLRDDGRVCGAFGYWRSTGQFVIFKARAVVLASGGLGRCYEVTSNSWECTGDGQALAYEAGAELIDMEFVQFHPTGMVWPSGVAGLLVTEAVRGEGGVLKNADGERFMARYDPTRMDLSTRDIVSRAIYTEIKEGRGTQRGSVYLDVSHLPPETVKARLPSMYGQFLDLAGVDITKEPMEVAPTCHYMMGGIKVDAATAATRVGGLYAAGECSGGMSGATRLGGNSLSDLLVFGQRAGAAAVAYARGAPAAVIDADEAAAAEAEMTGYLGGKGDVDPYELLADLRRTMQSHVGIFRDEAGLAAAVGEIEVLKERARNLGVHATERRFNTGWHLCADVRNLLVCAEAIVRSALIRTESRGAHSRLDFPEPSEEWAVHNLVAARNGEAMSVEQRPLVTVKELEPLVDTRKSQERR